MEAQFGPDAQIEEQKEDNILEEDYNEQDFEEFDEYFYSNNPNLDQKQANFHNKLLLSHSDVNKHLKIDKAREHIIFVNPSNNFKVNIKK